MVYSLLDNGNELTEDTEISFKETEIQTPSIQIPLRSRKGRYSKLSIPADNCYENPLDFSNSSWREQFEDIQRCYSENYNGHIPLGKRSDSFFQSYVKENE